MYKNSYLKVGIIFSCNLQCQNTILLGLINLAVTLASIWWKIFRVLTFFTFTSKKPVLLLLKRYSEEGVIWRLLPGFSHWTLFRRVVKMTTNIRCIIILEPPPWWLARCNKTCIFLYSDKNWNCEKKKMFYPNSQLFWSSPLVNSFNVAFCWLKRN